MSASSRLGLVVRLVPILCVFLFPMDVTDGVVDGSGTVSSRASEDSVTIGARLEAVRGRPGEAVTPQAGGPVFVEKRSPVWFCGTLDASSSAPCVEGVASGPVVRTCDDGSEALAPLRRREVDPVTGVFVGLWVQVDGGGCPEDADPPVVLSVEEFRRLPLAASVPSFQPASGQGLVNLGLIVFTDPAVQELTTTVLGHPVVVRATPTVFSWDFGDGSEPLVTREPGAPYPVHTVGYPYPAPGTYQVQLLTTWEGQYQVDGQGLWRGVAGTAQTASEPFTATIYEARSRLVDDILP